MVIKKKNIPIIRKTWDIKILNFLIENTFPIIFLIIVITTSGMLYFLVMDKYTDSNEHLLSLLFSFLSPMLIFHFTFMIFRSYFVEKNYNLQFYLSDKLNIEKRERIIYKKRLKDAKLKSHIKKRQHKEIPIIRLKLLKDLEK